MQRVSRKIEADNFRLVGMMGFCSVTIKSKTVQTESGEGIGSEPCLRRFSMLLMEWPLKRGRVFFRPLKLREVQTGCYRAFHKTHPPGAAFHDPPVRQFPRRASQESLRNP